MFVLQCLAIKIKELYFILCNLFFFTTLNIYFFKNEIKNKALKYYMCNGYSPSVKSNSFLLPQHPVGSSQCIVLSDIIIEKRGQRGRVY